MRKNWKHNLSDTTNNMATIIYTPFELFSGMLYKTSQKSAIGALQFKYSSTAIHLHYQPVN